MLLRRFHAVALLVFYTISATAFGDDVEASRIYGKMFVAPMKVGSFAPVCVVEAVTGPTVKVGYKAMRDPQRPAVLVFCSKFDEPVCRVIKVFDASNTTAGMPLLVTITDAKGIAGERSEEFDATLYYTPEQTKDLISQITKQAATAGLKNATVGLAVNRFWNSAVGYTEGHDMLVGFVKGKVLLVEAVSSKDTAEGALAELVARIEKMRAE